MIEIISRVAAVALGLPHYFTGKQCKRGHVCRRRVDNCNCMECCNEASRARILTTEQQKLYNRSNYERNGEKIRAAAKAYRAENPEATAKQKKEYHERKPWVKRALHAKRRSASEKATPAWHGELDSFVEQEAARLCRLREIATSIKWQVDHMIPLQAKEACGLHIGSNLQVIPAKLNQSKSNRMKFTLPGEWLLFL